MKRKIVIPAIVLAISILSVSVIALQRNRVKFEIPEEEKVVLDNGEELEFVKKSETELQTEEKGFYEMTPEYSLDEEGEKQVREKEKMTEKEYFLSQLNDPEFVKENTAEPLPEPTEEKAMEKAREEGEKRGQETLHMMNLAMETIYNHTGNAYIYEAFVPADLKCVEDALYVIENKNLNNDEKEAIKYYLSYENTIFTISEKDSYMLERVQEIID